MLPIYYAAIMTIELFHQELEAAFEERLDLEEEIRLHEDNGLFGLNALVAIAKFIRGLAQVEAEAVGLDLDRLMACTWPDTNVLAGFIIKPVPCRDDRSG